MARRPDDTLFDPTAKTGPGPVYQGVCAQIRALFPNDPDGKARKAQHAGTIAQARSLAASLDRVSGHGGTRQASGHQLAMMHDQLDKLLERLDPDSPDADPFDRLLEELTNGRAQAPHAPVD